MYSKKKVAVSKLSEVSPQEISEEILDETTPRQSSKPKALRQKPFTRQNCSAGQSPVQDDAAARLVLQPRSVTGKLLFPPAPNRLSQGFAQLTQIYMSRHRKKRQLLLPDDGKQLSAHKVRAEEGNRSRLTVHRQSKPGIAGGKAGVTAVGARKTVGQPPHKGPDMRVPVFTVKHRWLPGEKKSNVEVLKMIVPALRELLEFPDYLSFLVSSKQIYRKRLVNKEVERILTRGISNPAKRRAYWAAKCRIVERIRADGTGYSGYAKGAKTNYDIEKDLDRTFAPDHVFHSNPRNLKRLQAVLKAFVAKNRDVGYIQGLNFVTGHLLLLFDDEEVTP